VNIENNIMSAEQHSVFQNFIIRGNLGPLQVLADIRPIVIPLSVHTFCRTITDDPMIFQKMFTDTMYIVIHQSIIYHFTCVILKQFILH
jgi:hypothetical protein